MSVSLWFGLAVTDGGMGSSGKGAFLSTDPFEHHQLVFVVRREPYTWYVRQPMGKPLDLDRSDEEIYAQVEREVRADPSCMPREQWTAQMRALMSRGDEEQS